MKYLYGRFTPEFLFPEGENPLLDMMESISAQAEKCRLDFSPLLEKEEVKTVAEFLSIRPRQAILFAVLLDLGMRKNVTVEILTNYFDCKMLRFISLLADIEEMEERFLVRRQVEDNQHRGAYKDISFQVSNHAIEALRWRDKSKLKQREGLSFPRLLDFIRFALREREDGRISIVQLYREMDDLMAHNQQHAFVKYLVEKVKKQSSKVIALSMAIDRLTGTVDNDLNYFAENLFDDFHHQLEFRRHMQSGRHELLRSGVASLTQEAFFNSQVLSLTQNAVKALYEDYPELMAEDASKEGVIPAKEIPEKELFFNPGLQQQVDEFTRALSKRSFKRFKGIAEKSRLNSGLTAMFYGFPGTGKTELVMQIARKTGRDLYMVDLSETRSMWFGQSEKQVKQIFSNYRELLNSALIEPILFINEADGLFSRRMEIGRGATSSTHTQNIIQNILLQELEQFRGILIATSNLTGNLDQAFERRFLMKIDFPKPDERVRQKIWMSKLPELSPEMAATLAGRFDLTGGQIDNQVKQLIMKQVLHKNPDLLQTLIETCQQEQGFSERKRIGFN